MTGQVALVTGAIRGIGLGAALALAREGFRIAVNGPEDDAALAEAVGRVRAEAVEAMAVPFDVTAIARHADAISQIEDRLGPLTTLVNNAGVGAIRRGDPLDVSEESWDRCHAVNTKAMFFLTQAFARRLLGRERDPGLFHSIVNITSSNAVAASVTRAEYCASKAGAAMVSKTWAVRLGAANIAVYDIQPGVIATDLTAPVMADYTRRIAEGLTLLPRAGMPDDMGRIVASLATGRLPYTTGQVIAADAGLSVQRF